MAEADLIWFRVILKKLLLRDTLVFEKTFEPPIDLLAKLSDKAKAAHAEIVKGQFSGLREPIRALVSAFLGEELPPVKTDGKWLFEGCGCVAIKIVEKPTFDGADSFPKDAVLARLPGFKFDDHAYYKKAFVNGGGQATNQALLERNHFRFATKDEIDKFVDALKEPTILSIKDSVIIFEESKS